ncbi:hypothetical protein XENTR_v10021469 [Xenopus tropicalis]|nr:hypothetical protein XENTR_v10021469 [Xenopus tropicalis]
MGVTYTETAEAPENISSEEKTSCECIEGESKNEFRSTSKLRKTFIQLFSADHKMPNSLIPEKNEDVKGHKQKMRRSRVFRFPCLRSAEKREKLKRTRKNDSHCTEQGGSGSYYKASLLRKHRLKSEVEMTSKFIEERTEEPQACELHKKLLGKDNIKNESRKEDLKDILKKNIVDRCEVQEGRMPRDCSENKNSLARDSVIDIQETGSARNMDMKNSLVEQERQTELGESNKVKYCLTPRKSGSKEYYLNSSQRLENSLTRHSEFKEDKIQCTDLKEKETHEEIMDWVKEPFTQGGQEAFQLQNNFQENEIQQTEICDDQQVIKDKIIFNNSDSKSIKEATCKTERLIQSEENLVCHHW